MSSSTPRRVVRRIAALYDVHGNLPALAAALAEVEADRPDLVVVGGDVVSGPMPRETLQRLTALEIPARWVMGNGDREVLAAAGAAAWIAERLAPAHLELLASFEATVEVEAEGMGPVLFCHGSPRSDEEMLTALTPPERLAAALEGVSAPTVVCGHTHVQFDRRAGSVRVLNAGSVGMPYQGRAGAYWLLLDGEPRLRRTPVDVGAAAEAIRATGYPDADELIANSLTAPVDPDWAARYFESLA